MIAAASSTSRRTRSFVAWAVGATLLALATPVAINLVDEAPTPAALELSQPVRATLPPTQNSYLGIVGFEAPEREDPIATGERIVAGHALGAAADPSGRQRAGDLRAAFSARFSSDRVRFVRTIDAVCEGPVGHCLDDAMQHREQVLAMVDANPILVSRYTALRRLAGYANVAQPDIYQWLLVPDSFHATTRLLLVRAALDAQSARADVAIAFLVDDIAFWRRVLASGGPLYDTLLASGTIGTDAALLSEIIALPGIEIAPYADKLRRALQPLRAADYDFADTYRREFASRRAARRDPANLRHVADDEVLDAVPHWIAPLFYRTQATLNRRARIFEGLTTLARGGPRGFARNREQFRALVRQLGEPDLDWIYNPLGKLVVASEGDPIDALGRLFDQAVYLDLVRAQLEIALRKVPDAEVAAFLARDSTLRNPYDEQPFGWDGASRTLSFEPAIGSSRESGYTEVTLAPASLPSSRNPGR